MIPVWLAAVMVCFAPCVAWGAGFWGRIVAHPPATCTAAIILVFVLTPAALLAARLDGAALPMKLVLVRPAGAGICIGAYWQLLLRSGLGRDLHARIVWVVLAISYANGAQVPLFIVDACAARHAAGLLTTCNSL